MARLCNLLFMTTMLAGLCLSSLEPASAQKSPNMPNISPVRPDFNMRAPNILRDRDVSNSDEVEAPKKKAKPRRAVTIGTGPVADPKPKKKKNVISTTTVKNTPPITGANLGSTPAGKQIEGLKGKIDVPALGAVQGAAALPGVLGTPGGDTGGLPESQYNPAGVGPIMTLPSPADQVGNDARATVRVLSFIEGHYHPQQSESTTGRTSPNGDIERVTTWDMGGGRKIEMRELIIDGVSSYVVTDTRSGRWVEASLFDERGTLRGNTVRYADDGESVQSYDQHGRLVVSSSYDSRGNVINMSLGHANPTSGGSGKKDSASGSAPVTKPTGTTDSSGNTTSSSSSASGSSSSGKDSSGNSGGEKDSNSADTKETAEKTAEKTDKPDKKSQPVEGGRDTRDYFGEAGITNPGDRPKEERRGPLVSGVAEPSGVIIRRDGPRTPDELKAAVTQPGLGDAQSSGGGGSNSGPAVSRFAQPGRGGQGTIPGVNSTNPHLSGSGVPEAGSGLIRPKPAD